MGLEFSEWLLKFCSKIELPSFQVALEFPKCSMSENKLYSCIPLLKVLLKLNIL